MRKAKPIIPSLLLSFFFNIFLYLILDLGYEELGKRGCHSKDLSLLDIDLKARHATMEGELKLIVK